MVKIKNLFKTKIIPLLKKYWYYIALIIVIILSVLGVRITFNILKEKKQEKEKSNIIDNNEKQKNKINEQEKKHEKDINDSNNTYNDLIRGKYKRKKS